MKYLQPDRTVELSVSQLRNDVERTLNRQQDYEYINGQRVSSKCTHPPFARLEDGSCMRCGYKVGWER